MLNSPSTSQSNPATSEPYPVELTGSQPDEDLDYEQGDLSHAQENLDESMLESGQYSLEEVNYDDSNPGELLEQKPQHLQDLMMQQDYGGGGGVGGAGQSNQGQVGVCVFLFQY